VEEFWSFVMIEVLSQVQKHQDSLNTILESYWSHLEAAKKILDLQCQL
jgi:hypothetical protein